MDFRESISQTYDSQDWGSTPNYYRRAVKPKARELRESSFENAILDSFPAETRRMLSNVLRPCSLKAEQIIFQEGDRLECLYFPLTAVVSEFKMLDDGRMVEIAVTGNEGAIGLSSLFSGDTVVHFTQVSQAGTALKIDERTFKKLIATDPQLRAGLSTFIGQYIKQISQKAICNMYHSVRERFCTWLLMLQDRSGKDNLRLTHEQIARSLGVFRPSVTCIAQELRDQHMIDYRRGGVSITSRDDVMNSACSCYEELCCT